MPRKIRELIADLEAAGFQNRGGKGSHRNFVHPRVVKPFTLSGIEWFEEDHCFVGSCPGLFYGGCHGEDEQSVFAELCQIVEETISLYEAENRPLPPITSGYDWANTIADTTRR